MCAANQSMSSSCSTACVSITKRQQRRLVSHSRPLRIRAPVIAELDRTLVQRAVSNLVSNAVAHTPPGGSVVLAANCGRFWLFTSKSAIRVLAFHRRRCRKCLIGFFRLDSSRSQASGGTGLGLAIVQSIMLLHGGKVEIASQLGQGTQGHAPYASSLARPRGGSAQSPHDKNVIFASSGRCGFPHYTCLVVHHYLCHRSTENHRHRNPELVPLWRKHLLCRGIRFETVLGS